MKYFLDTNLIIDFLNKKPEAMTTITRLAQDESSEIFVNRLVYLEALRTIPITDKRIFREAKAVFEMFVCLDITQEIYDQAIALSRYCRSQGITIKGKCAAIDFLHFITATYYQLELLGNDTDMQKLTQVYPEWIAAYKQTQ